MKKYIIIFVAVLLFALAIPAVADSPVHGNFEVRDGAPCITYKDTTTGHDDWRICVDSDATRFDQWVNDTTWTTRATIDSSGISGIGGTGSLPIGCDDDDVAIFDTTTSAWACSAYVGGGGGGTSYWVKTGTTLHPLTAGDSVGSAATGVDLFAESLTSTATTHRINVSNSSAPTGTFLNVHDIYTNLADDTVHFAYNGTDTVCLGLTGAANSNALIYSTTAACYYPGDAGVGDMVMADGYDVDEDQLIDLAGGGLDADMSDPGASAIVGWNDTLGQIVYIDIGTGIQINDGDSTIDATFVNLADGDLDMDDNNIRNATTVAAVYFSTLAPDGERSANMSNSAAYTGTGEGDLFYQIGTNRAYINTSASTTETLAYVSDLNDDYEIINSVPTVTFTDTTAGQQDFNIQSSGGALDIKNMSAGGGTVAAYWSFFANSGGFTVGNGAITIIDDNDAGSIYFNEGIDEGGTQYIEIAGVDALASSYVAQLQAVSGTIALVSDITGGTVNEAFKTFTSDSGDAVADAAEDTVQIVGGTGISTAASLDVITITATGGAGAWINTADGNTTMAGYDLTGVGGLYLNNGTTSQGYAVFYEDEDNGTDIAYLYGAETLGGNINLYLPAVAGTVALLGDIAGAPIAGTNVSVSGQTVSVINDPSFAGTVTMSDVVNMSAVCTTDQYHLMWNTGGEITCDDDDAAGSGAPNAFSTITVDGTPAVADSSTDTLILSEGTGMQFVGSDPDTITLTWDGLLNELGNPGGNSTFTMGTNLLKYSFTNPTGADGLFEVEGTGIFSGDLMHIHQHTGNPVAGVDLLQLEAADADVLPLRIVSANATALSTNADIKANDIIVSGLVDGVDIATRDHAASVETVASIDAGTPIESFVVAGSALTAQTYPLMKTQVAITITDIHCITDVGTVIMELEEGTATAYDGGAVVDSTITCDSNGAEDDGSLTNGTINAGDWIAARFGTEVTSPTILGVTFYYTVD